MVSFSSWRILCFQFFSFLHAYHRHFPTACSALSAQLATCAPAVEPWASLFPCNPRPSLGKPSPPLLPQQRTTLFYTVMQFGTRDTSYVEIETWIIDSEAIFWNVQTNFRQKWRFPQNIEILKNFVELEISFGRSQDFYKTLCLFLCPF